jgi:hypothetical protein
MIWIITTMILWAIGALATWITINVSDDIGEDNPFTDILYSVFWFISIPVFIIAAFFEKY